jgi:hypothetical protein
MQWSTAVAPVVKNGGFSLTYCIAPEFGLPVEPMIVLNGMR